MAAHHAIPMFDLSGTFDHEDPAKLEIAAWDDHPNAAGHERLFLGPGAAPSPTDPTLAPLLVRPETDSHDAESQLLNLESRIWNPDSEIRDPRSQVRNQVSKSEQDGNEAHGWTPPQPTSRRGRRAAAGASGRRGRTRPDADLCRAVPRRRPAGDAAGALGRRPRRPRGPVAAQGDRGGRRPIHGVLRAGAAYVPVDPTGPPRARAAILADGRRQGGRWSPPSWPPACAAWPGRAPAPADLAGDASSRRCRQPRTPTRPGDLAGDAAWSEVLADDAPSPLAPPRRRDDLAYILFTSGRPASPRG